jgi:hypothetical protein
MCDVALQVDVMSARDRKADNAARLLSRAFEPADLPLAFRLWDGTTVRVGRGDPAFALVFTSRRVFKRLLLRPTPLRFGEAFIGGDIDIEGDVFAAMEAAHRLEGMRWPVMTRVAMVVGLLGL